VARAKRIDRAEARRRYRAAMLEQGQGDPETREIEENRSAATTRSSAVRGAPVQPGQRVGIVSALKLATRPVHYGDDLRFAPTLILRTNAIWPTVLVSLAGLAYGLMQTDYTSSGMQLTTTLLIASPPLVQPMLAGFLAPRATWLAGIISSLISSVCLWILLVWAYSGHVTNLPPGAISYVPVAIELTVTAITFGALLGAASGWYKRFLSLSSGGGSRNQKRPSSQKPAARRSSGRR
jgi:hypothetical protein